MTCIELFSGAGGLALGIAQAGFKHLALIDNDKQACETIRQNQGRGHNVARDWPLYPMDVRRFDFSTIQQDVDLLAAGVPCQPFSIGGKGLADRDTRNMFGEVIRAAASLRPRVILVENVRGILRNKISEYLRYIVLAMSSPTLATSTIANWQQSIAYLREHATKSDLKYNVHVFPLNAADFGVPQHRERVFFVAFRSDICQDWLPPKTTNGLNALVWAQCKTGLYWTGHGITKNQTSLVGRRVRRRSQSLKDSGTPVDLDLAPWRTVRDAICDLPAPKVDGDIFNHELRLGARPYQGHSGSILDEPAKTLKAGNHGVPGGENSLVSSSGDFRYFSVRECARLQTFPDNYIFSGSWSSMMRQVGNAVPVLLARIISDSIREHLLKEDLRSSNSKFEHNSMHYCSI